MLRRALLASLVALAGCASQNPDLYAISIVPGTPQPGGPKLVVLHDIGLARYLERLQIVRSSEDYRLNVRSNDWWGEPLGAMLARVLVELCQVVDYLHDQGHTHGSLSPEYIFFDAPQLRPMLLDSTLALFRFEGSAPSLGSRILVRPEYLSPERIQGQRADALADIYALGVILFELVTGTPPFAAKDPGMVRQKHLRETPPSLAGGSRAWR